MAYDFHARSCDYNHLGYNEPDTVLIAQMMGSRRAEPGAGSAAMPSDMYAIPNRKVVGEVVGLPTVWETPLRPATCAIRMARNRRSPPNRLSTKNMANEIVQIRSKLVTNTAEDGQSLFVRALNGGGIFEIVM